jgi:competence ComEA-like helix-hairpin-helix protein
VPFAAVPGAASVGLNPSTEGQPGPVPAGAEPTGPPLIDEARLMDIADSVTVSDQAQERGLINVNTASAEVLACIPGIDREVARAIINYRSSAGYLRCVAALLQVPGLNREAFRQLVPFVTVRSETFRILSEGRVSGSGARRRIEVVVHVGSSEVETLSYREII